jgi:hypothetical protein
VLSQQVVDIEFPHPPTENTFSTRMDTEKPYLVLKCKYCIAYSEVSVIFLKSGG